MSEQVPAVVTPCAPPAVYSAMADAYQAVVAETPSRTTILSLMAQWALETGNGGQCNNYNAAGLKWYAGDPHDYATYPTREFVNGQWVTEPKDFKAYPSMEAGLEDYLKLLRTRYGFCWPAIVAGDMSAFAHALKQRGYYTAPEAEYAAGLVERQSQMAKACPEVPDTLSVDVEAAEEVLGKPGASG
jgi:flagellum-specific peptidoglycan hydrolase FlgJ